MTMGKAQPKTISPVRLNVKPVSAGIANLNSALTTNVVMVVANIVVPVCRRENNVHITGR